ncbi:hypothetical protein [Terribacillus saccharophilus]|uniref:hypothetical protein n=1 Tax=Terribacillus saccharophilus TaxID=361277 RepID=UPI002DCFE597|nr:hypothetical protein [Terribacillus saccharophilus]MEC0288930.1 hypothetical protein [Terribacillus saccharophilus]
MKESPSIDQYLISTCLFIVDEFNEKFKDVDKTSLKEVADSGYSEADLIVRLGYPFRQMAKFNMQGPDKRDIVVDEKDFQIEVKFLRNWKSSGGGNSNTIVWSELEKKFDWLSSEIEQGKKGKRALVFGWFNAVERLSQIIQLGTGSGRFPDIDKEKIKYFDRYLNSRGNKTKDIFYMYQNAYKEHSINIHGYKGESMSCIFLGNEKDKFHMAIYY